MLLQRAADFGEFLKTIFSFKMFDLTLKNEYIAIEFENDFKHSSYLTKIDNLCTETDKSG